MVEQGVPGDHDPEVFQKTRSRFTSEGEGDVREPALESLGPAAVVRGETGQAFREDRSVAVLVVAKEPSDAQANGDGYSLPGQVGQRPRVPGMDPGGSLPAQRAKSHAGRGARGEDDGVPICANADEVQQLGGGQDSTGV